MNKTVLKNFAIWARKKLISDITYRANLLGVSENGIAEKLPQSTDNLHFYDIGIKDYAKVAGAEIAQRAALVEAIEARQKNGMEYKDAFRNIVEEVAYTWFNRLIAIRFMEVNDYLPSGIRVLSSRTKGKIEPDFVTTPFDTDLKFTPYEQDRVIQLRDENKLNELFRMLFIKQCNKLNEILPELFEKTNDYTELLLTISFTDRDGVLYKLTHDIDESDFDISHVDKNGNPTGQIEIIGWLYQYYNTEPKDTVFADLKKNVKISKENIPAATQLFTPDWIVRYMVENSLGRLWVEGHPSDSLKSEWKYYLEEAEQENSVKAELAKIREEHKKLRPEDIKVIDPCMGSGHILVYAFDVLMQIYESQGYAPRDAAGLIVQNNLYGIDIDSRAYQLTYFAVMMKARQYDRRFMTRGIKPHVYAIEESNNIDRNKLTALGADMSELERNSACSQLNALLDALQDAKEYGSILKVDNYDWELLRRYVSNAEMGDQIGMESIGIEKTIAELNVLIDVGQTLAQKYDVVVTNPPYMGSSGMSTRLSEFVKKNYPDSKSDLFAVFIERCGQMARQNGYQAMITQHAWMFLSSFEKLREKLLASDMVNMAHLDARAFEEIGGEVVQTTSFVMRKSHEEGYMGTYCRLVEPTTQQGKKDMFLAAQNRYTANQNNFSKIPGSPVAYWASDRLYDCFENARCLSEVTETRKGLATSDNNRFLRLWHEISEENMTTACHSNDECKTLPYKWYPHNKGGAFSRWYGNNEYVINWKNDGNEIRNFKDETGKLLSRPQNTVYNFKQSLTWSKITSGAFSARFCSGGFLFDDAAAICHSEDYNLLLYVLALLNTAVSEYIVKILNPTINRQISDVGNIPVILASAKENQVEDYAIDNISISRTDWDSYETSWDFKKHPLIGEGLIGDAYSAWKRECEERFLKLKENEEELNRIFIDIYGLQDELTPEVADKDVTVHRVFDSKDDVPESMKGSSYVRTMHDEIVSLVSYAVGCMLGRYSLDAEGLAYAGGEWDDSKYETFIPDADNCLPITDEEYFEDDIVGLFCAWLKKVYGEDTLEDNLEFVANALGNKGNTSREIIRNYFLTDFIKDHIKTYHKRPIYWLFDSGKQNGFKALVYMHRWNADTIGNVRVEYLHRIQRVYEREIIRMQDIIDNSKDNREITAATKRKEKLQKQVKETKEYDAKIAHLALSRIDIDLDDGVKINYDKVQTGQDGQKLQILAKI